MTKSVALEGLGGPMTRARTKRAKEAIQQVLAALIQKELNLEGCKPKQTKSGSYLDEFLVNFAIQNAIFPLVLESLNSEICSSRSSRALIVCQILVSFANSNLEKIEDYHKADKFLGFVLTQRGIEANPEKCQLVINMRSPSSVKEVQQLIGRITTLSHFFVSRKVSKDPFVSKALQGAKQRYQKIEKVVLAIINTTRRLRPYF
ncbi:hypothetical protein CR513_51035, partial [Mucuna pruriens]